MNDWFGCFLFDTRTYVCLFFLFCWFVIMLLSALIVFLRSMLIEVGFFFPFSFPKRYHHCVHNNPYMPHHIFQEIQWTDPWPKCNPNAKVKPRLHVGCIGIFHNPPNLTGTCGIFNVRISCSACIYTRRGWWYWEINNIPTLYLRGGIGTRTRKFMTVMLLWTGPPCLSVVWLDKQRDIAKWILLVFCIFVLEMSWLGRPCGEYAYIIMLTVQMWICSHSSLAC